jgi:hypothetical protein
LCFLESFRILSAVYWWREEDPFHFWRFSLLPFQSYWLDMTENRIFTLCHMITWVVFLRMFWNFISSLLVKRGGSLSFLVRTISNILVMEIGWTDVGSGGYILVSCAHSNTSSIFFLEIIGENLNVSGITFIRYAQSRKWCITFYRILNLLEMWPLWDNLQNDYRCITL